MKKFAQFIKTLHENLYSKTIDRITSENVPCAVFAPFFYGGSDAKRALIEQIRNRNVNLKYLFSVESEEFQNPPADISVLGIYAPLPEI